MTDAPLEPRPARAEEVKQMHRSTTYGSYRTQLPKVFPHTVSAPPEMIRAYVTELMQDDRPDGLVNGSSFAVTVEDAPNWTLWMSDASWNYLDGDR